MKVERLNLPGVLLLTPPRFGDSRGFFSETWNAARAAESGIEGTFIQDNHSLSATVGTLRGLHLQIAPNPQGKLVRVVRGAIWDVAVDVRHGSPTFGQHAALQPDTEVLYKVTGQYDRAAERGVMWNDPDLKLPWPVPPSGPVLSDKDRVLPRLGECPIWFRA
jgi:dTDP-4-dehydrorhamnose 3,5-epimerase